MEQDAAYWVEKARWLRMGGNYDRSACLRAGVAATHAHVCVHLLTAGPCRTRRASALRSMATAARLGGIMAPAPAPRSPPAASRPTATFVLVWSAEHHVAILDLVGKALLRCPPRGLVVSVVLVADAAGVCMRTPHAYAHACTCPHSAWYLCACTDADRRIPCACMGSSTHIAPHHEARD